MIKIQYVKRILFLHELMRKTKISILMSVPVKRALLPVSFSYSCKETAFPTYLLASFHAD